MSTTTVQKRSSNADPSSLPPGMTVVKPLPDRSFPINLNMRQRASESDGTVVVSTADLNAALNILTQHGRLLICGLPGSGKTRLADAVQKVFFSQRGYTPKRCTEMISTCHSHLLHLIKGPHRHICIEDDSMGYLRCCREIYINCLNFLFNTQHIWDRPPPSSNTFSSVLVITVYPHILREIQELDKGSLIPLADPRVVLHLTQDPDQPALPYVPDLLTYSRFLSEMMAHGDGRPAICAVLALTLEGQGDFLRHPPTTEAELRRLGFPGLSCYRVAEMADFLRGFILAETGSGFVDRFTYEAAGLAMGRSYSETMAQTVCDTQFMAKYIRMDADAKTEGTQLAVVRQIDYPRRLFLEKMYQGIAQEGALMELCQHPSLAYVDVVQEFAEFCSQQKNHTERVMSVVDTKHRLPLLYWSVWNLSTHLNCWCLTSLENTIRKSKVLTEPLLISLLASILFAESGDSTLVLANSLVKGLAHHRFKPDREDLKLNLPVPTLRKEDAKVRLEQVKTRLKFSLCYLEDAELSVPATFVKVYIAEDTLTVQVPSKSWYLLLRLLTDRQLEEKDDKGNTVLHLAAQSGHNEVIKMILRSRASLTVRNKKGLTPYQVAGKAKQHARKGPTTSKAKSTEGDLHTACREGDLNAVKVLLCQGGSLEDREDRGNTPLHTACRAGHAELVELMLQLKADLNARNADGRTPLQEAITSGHQDLARLLVQHGATVSKTLQG